MQKQLLTEEHKEWDICKTQTKLQVINPIIYIITLNVNG